jgi:tetratricopeptide (TPR) repeat protein
VTNLIIEAQQLHSRQRIFEALQKLTEAEAIAPKNAVVHNVRGSLYTAMRDFPKARVSFTQAQTLSPDAFEPRFNLVEIDYVEGKYVEAETGFKKILEDFPKVRLEVRHLALFKVLVSQLKQGKIADAELTSKAFTFMDDTPAYYFTKAAFAFQAEKKAEGQEWVNNAGKIFKQENNVPYLDTLMEGRWIPSLTVPDAAPATTAPEAAKLLPDEPKK